MAFEIVLKASKEFISGSESNRTLYLWGKRGTGKQYLMHAVNRTFLDNNFHIASFWLDDVQRIEGQYEYFSYGYESLFSLK